MPQPSFRTKLASAAGFPERSVGHWSSWLPQALLIIAASLWAFSPAFRGEWLWDDLLYITDNPVIRDPLGFLKVWTTLDGQGDYYPLTQFVWWLEWQHLGDSTLGYHLVNVALHLASAFLVWILLAKIGLRFAWVGGLLFAVHPVTVESVAWISELKNTLSLPLLLLAMICWLQWKEGAPIRFVRWSLLCFVLSLLAKIAGLMLPFLLLGYVWAARGRIERRDLRAVVPFFAVMVVFAVLTFLPHGAPKVPSVTPPEWHLTGALAAVGWGFSLVLAKCLWPVDLLPVYGGYGLAPVGALDLLPWLGFGGLCVLLWRARNGWGRIPLLGFGFFALNIVPIFGFTFLHYNLMNWSVDHLAYLPVIGLIGAFVAVLGALELHLASTARIGERGLVAIVLALFVWKTHSYAHAFESPEALWTLTVASEPNSSLVQQNLGTALSDHGKFDEAAPHLERAIELDPSNDEALVSLGKVALRRGDRSAAEADYRRALAIAPNKIAPYVNLGGLMFTAGRNSEAVDFYRKALAIAPDSAQVQYDLGNVLLQTDDIAGALEHLSKSEQLDPSIPATHENLGVALARSGQGANAIGEFITAAQMEPGKSSVHVNLGLTLAKAGRVAEAIEQYQQAVQLDPANTQAQDTLARLQQFQMQQPTKP